MTVSERLLEELRADLEDMADRLGAQAGNFRLLAERVAVTSGDAFLAQLAGGNVEVAQRALRASYADLAAITAQAVADDVLALAKTALRRILDVALTAVRAI